MWRSLQLLSSMLLLLSLGVVLVSAQNQEIQAPDCLPAAKANWNWTYNTLQQAPCTTAGYLAAECNGGRFTIPKLVAGNHYTGPASDDKCQCNSVLYSVISACAGCQKGTWLTYDQWTANCSSSRGSISTFPQAITNSTRVPAWAFLNVTTSKPWDNITACNFGGTPESVGTFRPSFAPQYSSGAALSAGVIAGAVAGSTVAGFAAIAAGVWYLVRRHRSRRTQKASINPSTNRSTPQDQGYSSVPWTPQSADMKFYDPADPSTYPNIALIPGAGSPSNAAATATESSSHTTTNESKATTQTKPSRQTNYLGLPEV